MRRSCRLSPVELRLTVDKDIGQEPVGVAACNRMGSCSQTDHHSARIS